MPETTETVSPAELARLSGLTYTTVMYHVKVGHVPASRDAKGLWRIPLTAARAFIKRPRYARDYAS